MPDILLRNARGEDEIKAAVDKLTPRKVGGGKAVYSYGSKTTKTVTLNMSGGNQIIAADADTLLTSVTVQKPSTLASANIKRGVNIGGEDGELMRPSYLISNGDVLQDLYFNQDYDLSAYFEGLTYHTDADSGLDVYPIGLGYFFAVDLTSLGFTDEYALLWNDGTNVVVIYTTTAVPSYGVISAGWQISSYTLPTSVTADYSVIDPDFLGILDGVMATSDIVFGEGGGIVPSGKINITDTQLTDVTNYATAQVVDANLVPANIAKNVTILGTTGTFQGEQKPDYLLHNGDTFTTLYFNTEYDLDAFLTGLTGWVTDPVSGLNVVPLGVGAYYAVQLDGLGLTGERAIVWNDGNNIVPIYSTFAPIQAYSIESAGWQVSSFSPGYSVTFDEADLNEAFSAVLDSVFALSDIAFGDHGSGAGFPAELIEGTPVTTSFTITDALFTRPLTRLNDGLGLFARQSNLRAVSLSQVSYVGTSAFSSCSSLSQVSLPLCQKIGNYAFASCYALQTIAMPSCSYVGDYAFSKCSMLSMFDAPSLAYIGAGAFDYCSQLISVNASPQSIGTNAFRGCSSLSSINVSMVAYVGMNAFDGCSQLSVKVGSVYYVGDMLVSKVYGYNPSIFSVSSGTRVIACSIFSSCSNLTTFNCLDTVQYINDYAFASCKKLSNVSGLAGCISIGQCAFSSCTSLAAISLPAVIGIQQNAFYGCTKLLSIVLPSCITIGSYAFSGCTSLTSVSIPCVRQLSGSAFFGCTKLAQISAPNVSYVGGGCFYNCTSLSTVILGSVSALYAATFQSCLRLISLYLLGSTYCSLASTLAGTFNSTPISNYSTAAGHWGSVFVRASLLTEYQAAVATNKWSAISSRFVGMTDAEIEALLTGGT